MRSRFIFVTVFALMMGAGSASAGVVTLTASSQGWLNLINGNSGTTGNYLAGNCGLEDCEAGEYRNYFAFGIASIPGPITSAALLLNTFGTVLTQTPSLTYQVTSLGADFAFADLGTGTFYGSRDYSSADAIQDRSIALNQDALDAIQAASLAISGGTSRLGGRVSSTVSFGTAEPDELIFPGSDGAVVQLVIHYSDGEAPVSDTPEPASVVMVGAGLAGLVARRYLPASSSR